MKKILSLIILFGFLFSPFEHASAYVSVKGYYKSNGTYVAPYVRSNPNSLKYDNYGYQPSQGLYNKTYGTQGVAWDTPTYVTDPYYYQGKAIHDSHSGAANSGSNVSGASNTAHLSPLQIQSILNLLVSFNADSSVVANVASALRN